MPQEGQRGSGRSTSSQMTDAINWAIAQTEIKQVRIIIKLMSQKLQ